MRNFPTNFHIVFSLLLTTDGLKQKNTECFVVLTAVKMVFVNIYLIIARKRISDGNLTIEVQKKLKIFPAVFCFTAKTLHKKILR